MKTFIYLLIDPILNQPKYIGKSIKPESRLRQHLIEAKRRKYINYKNNWIYSLVTQNLKPIMVIIDETDSNWWELEEYWISQFKTWGFDLVNGTEGGENPPSFKGKTHSDEYKEIRRNIMKENNPSKNMDDNWRNNISLAHKTNGFLPIKATEANKRKVNQYTLNNEFIKTWDSLTEAAISLGLKSSYGIGAVCNNKRNKAGGFKWSFN